MSGIYSQETVLKRAYEQIHQVAKYLLLFSFASNVMVLSLPLYSLQVFERIPTSGSMETLVILSLICGTMVIFYGLFTLTRSFVLMKIGTWLDEVISRDLLRGSLRQATQVPNLNISQRLRDVQTVKQFVGGSGFITFLDLPWTLIYLLVLYLIHPLFFLIALIGGGVLCTIALANEKLTRTSLAQANEYSIETYRYVDASSRNAEVIHAMGMMDAVIAGWSKKNGQMKHMQIRASERAAKVQSSTQGFRMMLQIIITGAGMGLLLHGDMTTGGMIASSILVGKALSPFEQAIGMWQQWIECRKSWGRLKEAVKEMEKVPVRISLPAPEGNLVLEQVSFVGTPNSAPILKNVSFSLNKGESLAIIGPSAAGKTTLLKLLVGIRKPSYGMIRLDGAEISSWNPEDLGPHIGYLPQDVELFEGSIRQNIARMHDDVTDDQVIAAARMARVHEMILRLPEGYETQIGVGGSKLSAGQRQRVGLARVFLNHPKLIVLDEPNANLDEIGDRALTESLMEAKSKGITTIVVTHRPPILQIMDKALVLKEGQVAQFGSARELLARFTRPTS